MLLNDLKVAPAVVPVLNVGGLLDIPTGGPEIGMKGETITLGGFHHINGVVGEGNVGKTQLILYMFVMALIRYINAMGLFYDCENHFKKIRLRIVAMANDPDLLYSVDEVLSRDDIDSNDLKRAIMTTAVQYLGDELWSYLQDKLKDRGADDMMETPFKGRDGKPIKDYNPFLWIIDSLSMFEVTSGEDVKDKALGDSKRNMQYMRAGAAKTQFMIDLQNAGPRYGMYTIMSAHIGKQYQLDPFAPPRKLLAALSQKQTIKNAPEKFLFNPHNVWMVSGGGPMWVSSKDKTPYYPKHQKDDGGSDQELVKSTVVSLRNKAGVSGNPFDILMSQTEGLLGTLSEFHYCKQNNRFGLGGNNTTMNMVLYPSVSFTRKSIRTLIREDDKLKCAIRLTSEILQANEYWSMLPPELFVSIDELYENLSKKGYDWDELLQTRGHWTPDQYTNEVPFLSGVDLLNMNAGTYHPYWMEPLKE